MLEVAGLMRHCLYFDNCKRGDLRLMMLPCLVFCRRVYLGALDSGWWIHEYVKKNGSDKYV